MSEDKIDNKVKRYPSRAKYSLQDLIKILNSNFACNVEFTINQITYIDPMIYVNENESIFLHCSPESRIFNVLTSGSLITIEVLNIKGIVLHSRISINSLNYESAIIYGTAQEIKSYEEKMQVFNLLINRIIEGRWNDSEKPTQDELSKVAVFRINIKEFSVKIREGFGLDKTNNTIWEGIIPVEFKFGKPIPVKDIPLPEYIKNKLI